MCFFIKVVVLLSVPMFAFTQTETCGRIADFRQIVSCAEKNSPDVLRAQSLLEEKGALVQASTQLLNPELSANSVDGTAKSQRISETDLALSFPIELGGRRAAREGFAQKDLTRSEADFLKVRAEVRKDVTIKLVRLRQAYDELELVNESLATFSQLVKRFESRPLLSPEQEVTLTVFKMAKGDYGLKQVEYEDELSQLESFLQVSTGLPLAEIKKALPKKVKSWASLDSNSSSVEKSPALMVMQSEIEMAQAEMNRMQGETWGTLAIGPSAKLTREGADTNQQYGINLRVPLPILSLNQGGRTAAAASVKSAELRKQLALNALMKERETLLKTYARSRKALEEIPSGHALEEKHKKLETLFAKGIVPSALVIEAHRTMVDFEKNRNERELKAIESLLSLQFIDGKNVELQP